MEASLHSKHHETIRKIEDIIEIQKAKGNFNIRQVAFNLPCEANSSTTSTNLVKSLDSGLTGEKSKLTHKRFKKNRSKRSKSPMPDVISWPSDSDITVLRMKLCLTKNDLKENVGGIIPGDGLHHPDSSSMVNLATLILQSQTTSKANMNVEEYLLPLTSWERKQGQGHDKNVSDEERKDVYPAITDAVMSQPRCSHENIENYYSSQDSDYSKNTKKSKMAKFLRLYFCPCCTCLYRLEKMQEEPSACFTKRKESLNVF